MEVKKLEENEMDGKNEKVKQAAISLFNMMLVHSQHQTSWSMALAGTGSYCNALKNAETYCEPSYKKYVFAKAAILAKEMEL